MDCHSLTRRQLQTLCKKYGIPANATNVHMANCLSDLLHSKPELEEEAANAILGGADATPKPAPKKAKGAQLEASSDLELINLPLFSTPANTAAHGEEKEPQQPEKNKFEDGSVPRTCMIDPSASQSRVKKGSVSFSDTVEVMKVMQSYDEPMVELTPSVNARRTRTTTRLSVGGTPAGRRNLAVKSDSAASEPVELKAVSATRMSSRKASSKEPTDTAKCDKIQETRLTPASRRERKTSSVNTVDNSSAKPAEGVSTARGRPPRTPRAQPHAGSNSALPKVTENGNDMVTPAACSLRKSSRSNFGSLERKHLDSEFERLGRSDNEKSSFLSTDDKSVGVEGEGDRRVTRGSIARVTRSASKSSITVSAQIMSITNATPAPNGRNGRLTRKTAATTSCLTKSFQELSLCDDDTQSIEASSIIASGTKEELVCNVAIKTDPDSVNTVSVDSGVEHATKAPNSELFRNGQFEECATASFGAVIPVGRSMEESGQDVPSKDSCADSDNIVLYEESQYSKLNEFIRGVIMSVAEDAMLNSDSLKSAVVLNKDETNSVPCNQNCHVSESGRSVMDCDASYPLKISDGPSVEVRNEGICSTDVIENIGFDIRPASSTNVVENANLVHLSAQMKGIIHNTANLVEKSEERDACNGLVIYSHEGTEAYPLEESSQGIELLNDYKGKDATPCLQECEDMAKSPKASGSPDATYSLAECSIDVPVESVGQSSTCVEECKESMNASPCLHAAYSPAKCSGGESGSQKDTFYTKECEEDVRSSDGLSSILDLSECIKEESVYHLNDSSEVSESVNNSDSNVTMRCLKEGETGVELEKTFESSDVSDSHADSNVGVESMDQLERVENVNSDKFETEDTSLASNNMEPLEDPVCLQCDGVVEPSNQSACSVFGDSEDAEEVIIKPMEDLKEHFHLEGTDLFLDVSQKSDLSVDVTKESDLSVDVTKESGLPVDVTKESNLSVDVTESSCNGILKHCEHEVGAYAVVEEDNEDICMDLMEHVAHNFSFQHKDSVQKLHCEEESEKSSPVPILECLVPGNVEAGVGLMVEQFTKDSDNGNPVCVIPNLSTELDVIVDKFANLCTSGDEEVEECTADMSLDSTDVTGQTSASSAEEHVKERTVLLEGEAITKGCSVTSEKHMPPKNGNMSMEQPAEAHKSVVEIEPCPESILAHKSNSGVESKLELSPNKPPLSSLSLRKLKELVKKKDGVKLCQTPASRSTKLLSKSCAPSKRVEREKPNETSESVTPVSGPKKPWRLSAKPTNSMIASQSSDSPSSVGKRSALKSLPSNVRQASTEGGRTPTGKVNIRGLGVVQVGSPATQPGDEGTENRLMLSPSRLALNQVGALH